MDAGDTRVLVVDDDEGIRTLLFTVLRSRGLSVDTARDGREALDRLQHCQYALLLLDLMMPHVSGWDVLETIARFDRAERPVIIVLSAGSEPRSFDPEIVAGSFRKPFEIDLLLDAVRACIGATQKQRQGPECPPAESAARRPPKA